mmetsp:Transcript_12371/g.33589  ORF Transcript_12371/g.33589 Transcript_12371/m.33589 type:complete len:962 (-) Transcript_12371:83-2968(-)
MNTLDQRRHDISASSLIRNVNSISPTLVQGVSSLSPPTFARSSLKSVQSLSTAATSAASSAVQATKHGLEDSVHSLKPTVLAHGVQSLGSVASSVASSAVKTTAQGLGEGQNWLKYLDLGAGSNLDLGTTGGSSRNSQTTKARNFAEVVAAEARLHRPLSNMLLEASGKRPHSKWGVYWLPGTSLGQLVTLLVLAAVMVFLFTLCWGGFQASWPFTQEIYGAEADFDEYEPWAHFHASMWMAWGLFFDPGTQTGISGFADREVMVIAAALSVLGFVFNLIFLGFIVDQMRTWLDSLRDLYSRDVCNDHIVVLGYSDKTLFLVQELITVLSDERRHARAEGGWFAWINDFFKPRPTIVVLGDAPRLYMMRSAQLMLPRKMLKKGEVRLIFREGNPFELEDLLKVSIQSARCVTVLGSGSLQASNLADRMVLSVVLAVQALEINDFMSTQDGETSLQAAPMVAELRRPEHVRTCRMLGGGAAQGICPSPIVENIWVLCALAPTVGQLLAELISFQSEGSDLQIRKSPKLQTFGEASANAETFGIAIAVIPLTGELAFAPDDAHVIKKDDDILYIAHKTSGDRVAKEHLPNSLEALRGVSAMAATDVVHKGEGKYKGEGKRRGSQMPVTSGGEAAVVVVLGWRQSVEMIMLLSALDDRLPLGSTVHILSIRRVEDREVDLSHEGGLTPAHVTLVHHVGDVTRRATLESLASLKPVAVLVASDDEEGSHEDKRNEDSGSAGQLADSAALTACAALGELMKHIHTDNEDMAAAGKERARKLGLGTSGRLGLPPFATQLMDSSTLRILSRGPIAELLQMVPFHRSAVEVGIITLSAMSPKMIRLFTSLLVKRSNGTITEPFIAELAGDFNPLDTKQFWESWHDLDRRLRPTGRILVGFRLHGQNQIHLNPHEKHKPMLWGDNDLLIFARHMGEVGRNRAVLNNVKEKMLHITSMRSAGLSNTMGELL